MIETDRKNIRIDYYNYRLKKGRADILLQKNGDKDEYCIPYRYVTKDERIDRMFPVTFVEDDEDLVLIEHGFNTHHIKNTSKEWVQILKVKDLQIARNEKLHILLNILRFFLNDYPKEGEQEIKHKVFEMLDSVKIEIVKKQYIDSLRRVLEGERIIVLDAHVTPPDPDLVRKEMETLEHFHLHMPEHYSDDMYSFEPIDWELLGAKKNIYKP